MNDVVTRASRVRLLGLDVDGVLTDGGVYIFEDGAQFRRFDIKDGLGLRRLLDCGVQVAIISAAETRAVEFRARHLGITEVHLRSENKLQTLREICERLTLALEQVAYVGDDLNDLAIFHAVGLPCAPANAVDAVRAHARYVTAQPGGYGAVREVCDLIIDSQSNTDDRITG